MRSLAVAMVLSSGLVGAATAPQAAPSEARDLIQVISQDARTSSTGAATNFTGSAQVEQLFGKHEDSRVTGGIVTFQPGARSVWHTHPVGQVLIVTAGSGLIQQWGSPAHTIKAGDVVWIPAGVKHWHGASRSSSVAHIAIQEMAQGRVVDWLEPVSDEQYASASQVQ